MAAVGITRYRLGVCALAGLFVGLMALHMTSPWQYRHEDNGAWFSAVARTHLRAGLAATRGQDFFQYRASGELKPYLHHPPLLGLFLAAAFGLTESDTPAVARAAMMVVQLSSFVVFALMLKQIFPASSGPRLWALMVFAVSPMSVFFGRTPSHEPLGLFFVLLGAYVCLKVAGGQWQGAWWTWLAGAAWVLAAFSAWHAAFCVLGFVPYLARHRKDTAPGFARMTTLAVLVATALVGLHLVWANHGRLEPSAIPAAAHWIGMDWATPGAAAYLNSLARGAGHAVAYCGYLPTVLAMAWVAAIGLRRLLGQRLLDRDLFVLSLSLGSWVFSLIFSEAVSVHVYYQFYLLPWIALSSAILIERLFASGFSRRHRGTAAAGIALAVLLTMAGCAVTLAGVYHRPYDYAVRTARNLQLQFY